MSVELDELFGPSRKHIHEYKEWVAVAKLDDRQSGDGPVDLDSGVMKIRTVTPEAPPVDLDSGIAHVQPDSSN